MVEAMQQLLQNEQGFSRRWYAGGVFSDELLGIATSVAATGVPGHRGEVH
jgi:hypothetical protein